MAIVVMTMVVAVARAHRTVVVVSLAVVAVERADVVVVVLLILLYRAVKYHLLFCGHVSSALWAFCCVHPGIVPCTLTLEYPVL